MKILMLADVYFPDIIGGAGKVLFHLSNCLAQKGNEIHIITRNKGGFKQAYENPSQNINIHRFEITSKKNPSLFFSEIIGSLSLAENLSKNIKFDLICAHQSMAAIGPVLLSKHLKGIPLVHYFHSPWHEEFLIKKSASSKVIGLAYRTVALVMKSIEKLLLNKSEKVFVLSKYMRNLLIETHNYSEKSISIIPGGIDLFQFQITGKGKTKELESFHKNKIKFLTIRNLVPRMGLENLIEAFNNSNFLRKKAILLIGGKGVLESKLKSMVDEFNLNNCINFLGYIPDEELPGNYQAADFFILPTLKLEGFGLVILEAMACGTPVLGTPVGAISEIIKSFDRKLLFRGADSSSIREKLEEIVDSPEEYYFASEQCRIFVENRYSWEKMSEMFINETLPLTQIVQ